MIWGPSSSDNNSSRMRVHRTRRCLPWNDGSAIKEIKKWKEGSQVPGWFYCWSDFNETWILWMSSLSELQMVQWSTQPANVNLRRAGRTSHSLSYSKSLCACLGRWRRQCKQQWCEERWKKMIKYMVVNIWLRYRVNMTTDGCVIG